MYVWRPSNLLSYLYSAQIVFVLALAEVQKHPNFWLILLLLGLRLPIGRLRYGKVAMGVILLDECNNRSSPHCCKRGISHHLVATLHGEVHPALRFSQALPEQA